VRKHSRTALKKDCIKGDKFIFPEGTTGQIYFLGKDAEKAVNNNQATQELRATRPLSQCNRSWICLTVGEACGGKISLGILFRYFE